MPFAALGQDFCEGNFDYDSDQDGTDAVVFKSDYGRSLLKNPCPPDGLAPVPKTGQTISYGGDGDDGDLQKGVIWPVPRFTDNADGTVLDHLTGLIWLKNANCFGTRTWGQAISDCYGLFATHCGLSDGSVAGDWRLPNRRELFSLIDESTITPALPAGHPFTNVQIDSYWTSNSRGGLVTYQAWSVSMVIGAMAYEPEIVEHYVWPVRGGH
jgi:hypothetical protein